MSGRRDARVKLVTRHGERPTLMVDGEDWTDRVLRQGFKIEFPQDDAEQAWVAYVTLVMAAEVEADVVASVQETTRGPSRETLDAVAQTYLAHIDQAPTQAVADLLGVSWRTAARRVSSARDAGLLPATTQGRRRA